MAAAPDPAVRVVADDEGRLRLRDFLEREWPAVHRAELRRLLRSERVSVNGLPASAPDVWLHPGDTVSLAAEPDGLRTAPEPEARPGPAVLLERADVLVVDKPAGMPLATHGPDSLVAWLAAHGRDRLLRPVLRMEAEASGCAVLAATAAAAAGLRAGLGERLRIAWSVLVEGMVADDHLTIERPLGPDRERGDLVRARSRPAPRTRAARTEVEVVERFSAHTLVRAWPHTEHGHQLRAHLAAVHHPVVGDVDYGSRGPLLLSELKARYKRRPGVRERPLLSRLFLHAERVELARAPAAEAAHAPLPADLSTALAKLRRFAAASPDRPPCA